jgi:hypothetical protein
MVQELLAHGADIEAKGYEQKNAVEWATAKGDIDVLALLNAHPRQCGLDDRALPAGTHVHVEGLGLGTYEHWSKNTLGANDHFVRFESGVQQVQLKKLGPHAWQIRAALPIERNVEPKRRAEAGAIAVGGGGVNVGKDEKDSKNVFGTDTQQTESETESGEEDDDKKEAAEDLTEYAVWIQNTIHWGSENEILTLAKHYNTEIVVVSCESTSIMVYNEGAEPARWVAERKAWEEMRPRVEEERNADVAMVRYYADRAEEPQLCGCYTIPINPDSPWCQYTVGDRVPLFCDTEANVYSLRVPAEGIKEAKEHDRLGEFARLYAKCAVSAEARLQRSARVHEDVKEYMKRRWRSPPLAMVAESLALATIGAAVLANDLPAVLRLVEAHGVNDEDQFAEHVSPLFVATLVTSSKQRYMDGRLSDEDARLLCGPDRERFVAFLINVGRSTTVQTHTPPIRALLSAGAIAEFDDALKIMATLLGKGADVNWADSVGMTPLMAATITDSTKCVEILSDAGADPTIQDHTGKSALQHAEMGCQPEDVHVDVFSQFYADTAMEVFRCADRDGGGTIDREELTALLEEFGDESHPKAVNAIMDRWGSVEDWTGEPLIPGHEFVQWWMARSKTAVAALLRESLARPQWVARAAGRADAALAPATRLDIPSLGGQGSYVRFEKKIFGANLHFLRFDSNRGAEQQVKLKDLQPSQWSVMPSPPIELNLQPMTGGEATTLVDVQLDWTVSRLKEAAGKQSGSPPELLRLVFGEVPLDDEAAPLSMYNLVAGATVNMISQQAPDSDDVAKPLAVAAAGSEAPAADDGGGREVVEGVPPRRAKKGGDSVGCCGSRPAR